MHRRMNMPRPSYSYLEAIVAALVDKLNDGTAKVRTPARAALASLGINGPSGVAATVTAALLRPVPPKQKSAWWPISSRLQVLADLVQALGVGHVPGLTVETLIGHMKAQTAFTHGNNEVRDAAKELTVSIQMHTGTAVLEPLLQPPVLRKNQWPEYLEAFGETAPASSSSGAPADATPRSNAHAAAAGGAAGGGGGGAAANGSASKAHGSPSPHRHAHANAHAASPAQPSDQQPVADEQEADVFTTCMFCNAHDDSWTEDTLDMHYWDHCPMLSPCPACVQVVEIAGLPEHLHTECEHKDEYAKCEVTGECMQYHHDARHYHVHHLHDHHHDMREYYHDHHHHHDHHLITFDLLCFSRDFMCSGLVIRKDQMAEWQRSEHCVPPPASCMYCPLCYASVENTDVAWAKHITSGCPKNPRIAAARTK